MSALENDLKVFRYVVANPRCTAYQIMRELKMKESTARGVLRRTRKYYEVERESIGLATNHGGYSYYYYAKDPNVPPKKSPKPLKIIHHPITKALFAHHFAQLEMA
jgi:predicted transcriptional regulator